MARAASVRGRIPSGGLVNFSRNENNTNLNSVCKLVSLLRAVVWEQCYSSIT